MKKRDNDFVDVIVALADEHFSRSESIAALQSAVGQKLASAVQAASVTHNPFNREESRWAIRRVLLRPNLWPEVDRPQGEMRRMALECLLDLCKDQRERAVMPTRR